MKKRGIIRNTINIIKKNWQKLGLILVFDILFILLLVNFRFIAANINTRIFIAFYGVEVISSIIFFLTLVIESLLLIAIYSFFKYLILGNIHEIFKKQELKFNRFFSFLKLNWMIGIPIILLYSISYILIMSHMNSVIDRLITNILSLFLYLFVIGVISLILFIYGYTLFNISHNIFLKEESLKKTIKQSLINSFKLKYYEIYWSNIKIIFISLIIFLIFYAFMQLFVLTSVTAYLKYGGFYKTGQNIIIILTAYFLLLFNRINFYKVILKNMDNDS